MESTNPASTASMIAPARSRWEILRQLEGFFARLKWGIRLVLLGGLVALLAEIASVYRLFHDVHPWLGVGAALVFAGLVGWLVGRPLMAALRVPQAVTPPHLADSLSRTALDCRRQIDYVRRYLQALRSNPELEHRIDDIEDAQLALSALAQAQDGVESWGDALVSFEREHVLPILAELDARVDLLIHREALSVGTMTALSPAGSLDVILVLWRNVNLVATIARMYYGRPGLRGSILILRDVSSAILLASVMEQLTDMSASLVRKMGEGSRAIPLVGAVVGPLLDGLVNALMTMKLGYLAKERCRSFEAWDGHNTSSVVTRTFKLVSASASEIFEELLTRVGGPLDKVRATADMGKETVSEFSSKTVDFLKGIRDALRRRRSSDPDSG